jgi:hypothetical protein
MSKILDGNNSKKTIENKSVKSRNRFYNSEAATQVREKAEEVRRTREPADKAKFDDFIKSDPLFSKLHLLEKSDDSDD